MGGQRQSRGPSMSDLALDGLGRTWPRLDPVSTQPCPNTTPSTGRGGAEDQYSDSPARLVLVLVMGPDWPRDLRSLDQSCSITNYILVIWDFKPGGRAYGYPGMGTRVPSPRTSVYRLRSEGGVRGTEVRVPTDRGRQSPRSVGTPPHPAVYTSYTAGHCTGGSRNGLSRHGRSARAGPTDLLGLLSSSVSRRMTGLASGSSYYSIQTINQG